MSRCLARFARFCKTQLHNCCWMKPSNNQTNKMQLLLRPTPNPKTDKRDASNERMQTKDANDAMMLRMQKNAKDVKDAKHARVEAGNAAMQGLLRALTFTATQSAMCMVCSAAANLASTSPCVRHALYPVLSPCLAHKRDAEDRFTPVL